MLKLVDIPSWHPPYEEPLQLQYPLHYVYSASLRRLRDNGQAEYDTWKLLKRDFKEEIQSLPGAKVAIEYVQAVTGAARASTEHPTPVSPLFFAVIVFQKGSHNIVHDATVILIQRHFPTLDPVIVRYFEGEYAVDFGDKPTSTKTPDSLEKKRMAGKLPKDTFSKVTMFGPEGSKAKIRYGKEKSCNMDDCITGMSTGMQKGRGKYCSGTCGPAFYLKDTNNKNQHILDENGDKQLFTTTSHHVVSRRKDDKRPQKVVNAAISIQEAEDMRRDPDSVTVAAHMSESDREDTWFDRQRRRNLWDSRIYMINEHPQAGATAFGKLQQDEQQEIVDDRHILGRIEEQAAIDAQCEKANPLREIPFGELYCSSGKSVWVYSSELADWPNEHDKIMVDYAIILNIMVSSATSSRRLFHGRIDSEAIRKHSTRCAPTGLSSALVR